MALIEKRKDLVKLLETVSKQDGCNPGHIETDNIPVFTTTIPKDLANDKFRVGSLIWVKGDAATLFFKCRQSLFDEATDGELEYLPLREVEHSLWYLVCEALLLGSGWSVPEFTKRVEGFIARYAREKEEWEILWEVENLVVGGSFTLANVTFFPLVLKPQAIGWHRWNTRGGRLMRSNLARRSQRRL